MVLATALWGATFVVVRASLASLDPAALVFARFTVSAAFFAPLLILRRRTIGRATVVWGAAAGALAAAGYLGQAVGSPRPARAARRSSPAPEPCSPRSSRGRCSASGPRA